MIAKELISENVPVLTLSDRVEFAINQMKNRMITHLPVVHQEEFLGILSYEDCLTITDTELPVSSAKLNLNHVFVTENDHLFAVVREIAAANIDILPVIDNEKRLTGSILSKSLLPHLAKMIAADSPGGVIVLEVNENDYNLAEITQIVQSNDAKILSVTLASSSDSQRMDITIKVNRIEVGAILQTFFRFNYHIKSSWSTEDAYHEGLHERFDALMNYLNI